MTTTAFPSNEFYAQLRRHEGFYERPYVCPAGAATIGYGANLEAHIRHIPYLDIRDQADSGKLKGRPLVDALAARGMRWSREQAEDAMRQEVALCVNQLEGRCRAYQVLMAKGEAVRAEILVNMCFNMGIGGKGRGLLSFVNTLALIEAGRYAEAAANMLKSRWAEQVKGRAVELAQQMRSGAYAI